MTDPSRIIRVGGASGYWGESDMALPQLLGDGGLDYIVFDYLAEVTMSIMAKARAKNPQAGYARDFVTAALGPHLQEIARQRVKIISNAGGVNPIACGEAIEALIKEAGVDLKVAVITGDDLIARAADLAQSDRTEMFSGDAFPDPEKIASINAYLGAFPIAKALEMGADIIVTGRCVDSAVTLAACIHEFGWTPGDLDALAGGSLAGHIIECGPQATGGNFTDWEDVAGSLTEIGYPIAEIEADGAFICTKPEGTGGLVSVGTVGEQMLYEIGDPRAYLLPDVTCDFSQVVLAQLAPDQVRVSGARGFLAPAGYKVSATHAQGYRGGAVSFFIGRDAGRKARVFADSVFERARAKLRSFNAADYSETLVEVIGDDSVYGDFAKADPDRSVAVKIAAKHEHELAVGLLLKEIAGHALAAPPGLSGFVGARYAPSPVLGLFSFRIPKGDVPVAITMGGETRDFVEASRTAATVVRDPAPEAPIPNSVASGSLIEVPLERLAFARSGDKGDKANIGVLPRHPDFAPWIAQSLTLQTVAARFAHFLKGDVERFYLPGTGALNFILHRVLGGGGVASLRNDPQGKAYAQMLLDTPITIPSDLAERA